VTVKQTLGSAWKQDGHDMSQWNSQLTAGSERVKSVQLSITGANITQLWELTLNSSTGLYSLPAYRLQNGGLGAGETHQFGYIWQSASQATIAVASIDCGSSTTPSPIPSPTGVAGSPSPAPASPSPSTIVSTPQPSAAPSGDCSLKLTQTKRSAAEGGSWTTGDFGFQIYDLALANNGQRAATYARLNVAFASGSQQQIYQFWNIERVSADSTVFNVPTPWGAIQVGASQGAGYIVRYPISAANSQADPTTTVLSVTCDGSSSGSPAPASPSASPAAPSASASPAAASPSPSTIVSTPQPSASSSPAASGCSATVSVSARSASNSGSWSANGANFQIFDLQIANTGSKALTAAKLTFTLPDGSTIFQWWELMSRANSATVYDVSFNYGPLQAGATQGAGIVGKSASASQATPTVTIGSLTCA
jgi:hypothetical protein